MSDIKTFQCPNCQQFINNLMNSCKFCLIPLDDQIVSMAATNQEEVNKAYNAASNLRILAGALATFFFVGFIPFLGIIASIGHLIILVALPFILIYWVIRYSRIETNDEDYKQAKKYWLTSLIIWIVFFAIQFFFIFLRLMLIIDD